MEIILRTDGKLNNISASTDRILLSIETDGVLYDEEIIYQIYDGKTAVADDKPFIARKSGRYLYLDSNLFVDGAEYFWRVTLRAEKEEIKSSVAHFIKGVRGENFNAVWIDNRRFNGSVSEFIKTFTVSGEILSARLYIVGLGFSESFLNGVKTDSFYFKPALTDFDDRIGLNNPNYDEENFGYSKKSVLYDTFDVKRFIKQGENSLKILLGTGWYCNEDKNFVDPNFSFGKPKLFFELRIQTSNGQYSVCSDENVLVRNIAVKSQMFAGDYVDFTATDSAFEKAEMCEPPTGELLPNIAPNDGVIEEIFPLAEEKTESGVLYDFGKNHTGSLVLKVKGNRGAKLTVKYFENKKNGKPDPISGRWYAYKDGKDIVGYIDQQREYVLSGDIDEIKPLFHWNCYRYASLEADCAIEIKEVKSLFIASKTDIDGEFLCSDEFLNKLHNAFVLTQLDNMHCGVPSDCPTREKLPYTGDGQLVSETVTYSFSAESFYRKWLKDIINSQGKNGFVCYTAPFISGGGGFWWSNALVVLPLTLYNYTGDKQIIKDAYEPCKKLVAFYEGNHDGDYVMKKSFLKWFLGEWATPDNVIVNISYVNTLAAYFAADKVLEMSKILGENTDTDYYIKLKEKLKNAINKNFFDDKTCSYAGGAQGSDIMPALSGIADENSARAITKRLVAKYEKDLHLDTGIVFTPWLFKLLSEAGRDDIVYAILTEKSAPSLYDALKNETTLVEYFVDKEEYGNTVSHCHPMFGSVLSWVYKNVAGADLSLLCDKRVVFAPKLIKKVPFAKYSKKTPFGKLSIEYNAEKDFIMKIEVPLGITAEVRLPKEVSKIQLSNDKGTKVLSERSVCLNGGEHIFTGVIDC